MNSAMRALLLTIIGIGAVLGLMWVLSGGGAERLEVDGRNFLDAYFKNDGGMMDAYAATTAAFTLAYEVRDFYDQRTFYIEILGEYRGIKDVVSESKEGDHGRLEMQAEFEKGDVPAVFDFRREKERWRIDDFELAIPRSMAPDRDWVKPRNFGRTLCSRWAQGDDGIVGVWKLFATSLRRQKDQALFVDRTNAFFKTAGAYDTVEDGAFEEANPDAPTMSYSIRFANSSHRADVALVWRKGRWFVTRFDVEGLDLN